MMNFLMIILLAISGVHGDSTTKASPGEFNYFVRVLYRGKFQCGGTIVDERHIIVRGTCVMDIPSFDLSIIAGTVDTRVLEAKPLRVRSVHIHYGFKAIRDRVILGDIHWVHDIAVLELVNRMVWNPLTAPAVLITGEQNRNVDLECVVPGWRHVYKDTPAERFYTRWTVANTYTNEECMSSRVPLLKNEKCIFWLPIQSKTTIHYYSGSPVVHGNTVIGIVDGRRRGNYHAFLNLFPYKDFIANVIDDRRYDVSPEEAKYVVSVWSQWSFKCGGTILNPLYILTTGYCVQYANQTDLQVLAGYTQVLENNPQEQWLLVSNIEIHPGYEEIIHVVGPKSMHIKNNNAVLTLTVPLTWGLTIGPVPLSNRYYVFTNQVCRAYRWYNAYTVDDKVLLQLVWSQEFVMSPEVCQQGGIDLEADEICVSSRYAQHPRSLDSSGNPVVCEGYPIGIIIPNFSTVPQLSCLSSVLSISSFISSLNNVCYGHPT